MAFKQRNYTEVPNDENMSPQIREFLASLLSQVNSLAGKGNPPSGQGIQALSVNTVDPTTGQVTTGGSRTSSVTQEITYDAGGAGSTQIIFYWDGTHSSAPFKIGRDDGSVFGPFIAGSPLTVTGLVTATTYFFFPYFDESLQKIVFASVPNVSVGTPPVAFLAVNFNAMQQQILRGHIPLGTLFATVGVKTANGTGGGGWSGGGGFHSGGGRGPLQ